MAVAGKRGRTDTGVGEVFDACAATNKRVRQIEGNRGANRVGARGIHDRVGCGVHHIDVESRTADKRVHPAHALKGIVLAVADERIVLAVAGERACDTACVGEVFDGVAAASECA